MPARDVAASDILAACSGYLYALQAAFDFYRARFPRANIAMDWKGEQTAVVHFAVKALVLKGTVDLQGIPPDDVLLPFDRDVPEQILGQVLMRVEPVVMHA